MSRPKFSIGERVRQVTEPEFTFTIKEIRCDDFGYRYLPEELLEQGSMTYVSFPEKNIRKITKLDKALK